MLRELLDQLQEADKQQLFYALEQDISLLIRLGNNFIGVNIASLPQLTVLESKGRWACGEFV